jgi:uncharacterized protein YcnI
MRRVLALAAVVVLGLSGVAEAHARLDKKSVKAGSIQALSVRVPGEEADAGTTKVVLEIPAGFTAAGCKEKAGWTCAITPDTTNGRNGLVTWTGSSKPKAVDFFAFTVRVPNKNGTYAFQVNQTYSDGDVAHWDQRPGEDHPAPLLEVSAGSMPFSTYRATAVLSPLKLNSSSCPGFANGPMSGRGKAMAEGSPSRAARSMGGPPGEPRWGSRATV